MKKRIFISGASSGIGEFLAYAYASRGATVGLSARRRDKLEEVAEKCRDFGSETYVYQVDAKDRQVSKDAADDFMEKVGGIDMVIANAGIGNHDDIINGDATAINDILETNIIGVTNTLVPFIPSMKKQKHGILVPISSVASFLAVPYHGGYSASKIAIRVIADSWRLTLYKYNIQITTICPGFIETPMTAGQKYRPFLLPVETAVEKIVSAIDRGKKTFVFPWQMKIIIPIVRIMPGWLMRKFS
ncbi:MAG: SDR family NAD(P)-dependent oxidoreductase [Candidatus Marinimicrobia bacterium]|nr:SDR family NAD(P)-dependent oxidoreductase [Candidatus Neomarinimicrobiota bacterium]